MIPLRMTKKDAINLRDESRVNLIGKPIFEENRPDWVIKDVIVGNRTHVGDIASKMWDDNITNELALSFFKIGDEDYDVFIISHQWPWGSGDLFYQRIESYLKDKDSK